MSDSLDDYRKKRDFAQTPEPEPGASGADGTEQRFVVHRHEARNLHYDLRLVVDGALVSFAVPKGFSYRMEDKRLAVRTEDHPLEYETFEGIIPSGQYGAGTMGIWDRGSYELARGETVGEELELGELKLILKGRRLRGEWHLVRTRQAEAHWLLFKSRDAYEGPQRDSILGDLLLDAPEGDLPKRWTPMRPKREASPFDDPQWCFELDFAGQRTRIDKLGEELTLRGVEQIPATLRKELLELRADRVSLDGVLVATDQEGRPRPEQLPQALTGNDTGLTLYLFDLLSFEEFDLRGFGLMERRQALRQLLPEGARRLAFVDPVVGQGSVLAEAVRRTGLPGLIAKRRDSPYRAGKQANWLRIPVDSVPGEEQQPLRSLGARSQARVTNPEKVYWPAEGITKGELVDYYAQVGEFLLPYLQDRPVHLLRYPDGIEGESFYQRQVKDGTPDWVQRAGIPPADGESGEEVAHHLCNDPRTLLYLANLGSIDLHPWHSRATSLETPDWVLLDLDPKEAPFRNVVRIARSLGRILRGMGLRPLLKTSGKTGLHIYVPLLPHYTYEQVRQFAEMVARVVVRELPDIATVERALRARRGKVYVDFGQNGRGQTVAAPYVVRPVPGASVSTPLAWDELESPFEPGDFHLRNTLERLREKGDLFRALLEDPQDLLPAIKALERIL